MKDFTSKLMQLTSSSGKTYQFDESHDPTKPAQVWFQESIEGLTLFAVFYTQACSWSKCIGCNLPSKSSRKHVNYKDIMAQIDALFAMPEVKEKCSRIKKFIFSNNGSVLDQDTFSSTALMYLMAMVNLNMPSLSVMSMETRPEYVELEELAFLKRALDEGETPTNLELAIGFEAFDDRIRNDVFNKGLSLDVFRSFVAKVAPFGYAIKTYMMQKPVPGMSDEEAVNDICRAIDYLGSLAEEFKIDINMHLNPTYVAYGTPLEKFFNEGSYSPPLLKDVARAALHAENKRVTIFIGLYDEGLAVAGGSFIKTGDEPLVEKLELFNRNQDYSILKSIK